MTDISKEFAGQAVLITGATDGIGQGIALAFARHGADVVVNGRSKQKATRVARQIEALGARTTIALGDVSNATAVEDMVKTATKAYGKIDVLVNNAGIFQTTPISKLSESDWDQIMAINLKGTFLCCKAVLKDMVRRGSGCVINMGSDAGKTGSSIPACHYAASKAGVMSLTRSLAREMAPHNIRVCAVSPGLIETKMARRVLKTRKASIPLGRLGRPEDVAEAVLFLASSRASYITGEILDVNAGLVMD